MTDKKPDPYFDLIMDESLAKNEWPDKRMAGIHAESKHQSLMAKTVNKDVFEKLKSHKTTSAGWTLARAINTGVMYPDSFVGIHAGDMESYTDFSEVFNPIVEGYHEGFKVASSKHVTDLNGSKITEKLSEVAKKRIVSTRIRVARNLAKFPLNPGGTLKTRLEIADLMEKVFATLPGDLAGSFFRHTSMTPAEEKQLVDDHFLFRGKDKMQAASGYHEHWPQGRGIFVSKDKQFLLWINEGDHLRIISMQEGGDVDKVFDRLSRGIAAIEEGLHKVLGSEEGVFMTHPTFGCVTCCPSNLGTGMRGSVHILVPRLIAKMGLEGIDAICRQRQCQARGSTGEHSAVVDRIDISNWRRLGFPEYLLVEDMIKTANYLATLEEELEKEEAKKIANFNPAVTHPASLDAAAAAPFNPATVHPAALGGHAEGHSKM